MQKITRENLSQTYFRFQKSVIQGKGKWYTALFYYISIALKLADNKNKIYKTLRDTLNFDILEKGLGVVSSLDFVHQ